MWFLYALGAACLGAPFGIRRWYRGFAWQGEADERHVARTRDGWNLGLARYRARGEEKRFPVICGHGMAGSSLLFDLHPDCSLARHLAGSGFDTWLLDLRGRRQSWPDGGARPSLQWSFDDFVASDLPAAVACVRERTGAESVFWIGTEMSGQLLYAAEIAGAAGGIRAGVTCGAPALTPRRAKVPGITSAPRSRRGGRVPFRGGASAAGPVLAYTRSRLLESSFRPSNSDPLVVARYLANGVPDEATDLVDQFGDWIENGTMRTRDKSLVYSDRLGETRLPLLVLAAERDLQRPADAVEATFRALGSKDKTFVRAGTAQGFSADFGHDDLLAGRASKAEIYPRIAAWLEAHC